MRQSRQSKSDKSTLRAIFVHEAAKTRVDKELKAAKSETDD